MRVDTDLAMHSVKLVVEGHGEIGGCAGGYMCYKGRLALIDCVVHVHPTLANLHVLEAGFDAAEKRDIVSDLNTITYLIKLHNLYNSPQKFPVGVVELTVCCVGSPASVSL